MLRPLPLERLAGLLLEDRGPSSLVPPSSDDRGLTSSRARFFTDRALTSSEVLERLSRFGSNDIIEVPGRPLLDLVREVAGDPMIWFLIATSGLYFFLGKLVEGTTLLAAIAPLIGMDAFLHRRTRASTEGLTSRLASTATVIRKSKEESEEKAETIPASEIVPGDIVVVRPGEPFPADGVVLSANDLQAEESSLTGEAYPIRKRPLTWPLLPGPEPPIDGVHWVFAGTRLLTGEARVRVVFTGGETLYGEIVRSAMRGARARTPLQAAIARLVSVLTAAATLFCLVLAAVRLAQGHGWVDALVSAVTLAVAALPEEFPVVFTFFLGVGVYRLARQQALVRRSVSVENIGRVSCICSDKTGTVTEGRLSLEHLITAEGVSERELLETASLASRAQSGDPLDTAIACSMSAAATRAAGATARTAAAEAFPAAAADLTAEAALTAAEVRRAAAAGPTAAAIQPWAAVPRLDEPESLPETLATFPFTEDRRRETTIVRLASGTILAAVKGSPEVVLRMTSLRDDEREEWTRRVEELAEGGHKVIACASTELVAAARDAAGSSSPAGSNLSAGSNSSAGSSSSARSSSPAGCDTPAEVGVGPGDVRTEAFRSDREPVEGYRFAGLLAFEDPVREGVPEAVEACREAGIHTLMVTGDHPTTARAVARAIGLGAEASAGARSTGSASAPPVVISGEEMEAMLERPGLDLRRVDVIARAVPAQKLKLVRALQSEGEIVAVTGDGVNDVPALRSADIGIAMGQRGTRSAREVAAIVLLDDNFRTIVRAIAEGRQLFRNLQLSFQYLLMLHIPLVLTASLIPLAGFPLLYLPVHVVWLEMIIHPTALLVFQELPSSGRLERRGRLPSARFFSPRDWGTIAAVGSLLTLLVTLAYLHGLERVGNTEHGRAMALAALTMGSSALTAFLSGLRTRASRLIAGTAAMLSWALIQMKGTSLLLHLEPMSLREWLAILGACVLAVGLPLALAQAGGAASARRSGGPD